MMQFDIGEILTAIFSFVGMALFAGNIFFIKRLIDKVDQTATAVDSAHSEITKLNKDVNNIGAIMRDLRIDIKGQSDQIRNLDVQVAVIKTLQARDVKSLA